MKQAIIDWLVTDEVLDHTRNPECGLTRAERAQLFQDRMLEQQALNSRYSDGRNVKQTIDALLREGKQPGFSRKDTIGRRYAKMAARYINQPR